MPNEQTVIHQDNSMTRPIHAPFAPKAINTKQYGWVIRTGSGSTFMLNRFWSWMVRRKLISVSRLGKRFSRLGAMGCAEHLRVHLGVNPIIIGDPLS